MNRKNVVDFINALETRYDVQQWNVCGVDLWPVLKNQIFFSWFEKSEKDKRGDSKAAASGESAPSASYSKALNSAWQWMRFYTSPARQANYVFSGADSHRADFNGDFINRYFDPLMDYLENDRHEQTIALEQTGLKQKKAYYKKDRAISIRPYYAAVNVIVKLRYQGRIDKEMAALKDLKACLTEVAGFLPGFEVKRNLSRLKYMVKAILAWSMVFDGLFSRIKPKYVFGLCYYSLQMYGMNLSAHRRGIVSVDMQHGTQGALHVSYTGFSKVPAQGYNVMPRVFWCWDKPSVDNITQWASKQSFHSVIQGGNPWLSFLTGSGVSSGNADHKRIILFTLQPVEPLLDDYLLKAIADTPAEYSWWLRLHPRQFPDKPRLLELLKSNGILDRVNIDDASQQPLPAILQRSDVHISKYSGAVIEASLLGTYSIVIDEIGVASFGKEISEGRAVPYLQRTSEGLLNLIVDLSNRKKLASDNADFRTVLQNQLKP